MLIQPLLPRQFESVARALWAGSETDLARIIACALEFRRSHQLDQFVAFDRDRQAIGYAGLQPLLHTTRGPMARLGHVCVSESLCDEDREVALRRLIDMCVTAASTRRSCRVDGTVRDNASEEALRLCNFLQVATTVMRRNGAPPSADPRSRSDVRQMRHAEYEAVRQELLPYVSGGSHVCDYTELRKFYTSGSFYPYVVEYAGQAVCYAELHVQFDALLGMVGHVERVVTHPDYRGRGFASTVVSALLAQAAELGLEEVELTVETPEAERLYTQLGFHRTQVKFWRLEPIP